MVDFAEITLRRLGPTVSGHLVQEMMSEHRLTYDAARQRLSRNKTIKRLAFLPFPKNARFLYLQEDYGAPKFWRALTKALLENTIAHGGALAALLARRELIPRVHFAIACGSPVRQKGHLSSDAVLERLLSAKLVRLIDVAGIGTCVQLSQQGELEPYEISILRSRLKAEEILLLAVRDWARKLGLVSYDKVKLRTMEDVEEQPKVGTFCWDLTGPTYLTPMLNWSENKPKPGFIVCDVLLDKQIQPADLKPFLTKCTTLRSLKGVSRCLQIFVASDYSQEARRMAKEAGIVPATVATLFGEEVAEALTSLTSLLKDTYSGTNSVERIDEIFSRLGRIEGVATNLRGALFEYLAAELVRRTSVDTNTRMNEIFNDFQGRKAEVDVVAVRQEHSTRFIECKGYKPGGTIPDEMVRRWLQDKIPVIRSDALENRFWRRHKFAFEFWTTGTLSEKSQAMITEAQRASPGKYTIEVFDREAIRRLAISSNDKALLLTLEEHFFEHPMLTVDRDLERRQRRAQTKQQSPDLRVKEV